MEILLQRISRSSDGENEKVGRPGEGGVGVAFLSHLFYASQLGGIVGVNDACQEAAQHAKLRKWFGEILPLGRWLSLGVCAFAAALMWLSRGWRGAS
jgi:hypothetical protein